MTFFTKYNFRKIPGISRHWSVFVGEMTNCDRSHLHPLMKYFIRVFPRKSHVHGKGPETRLWNIIEYNVREKVIYCVTHTCADMNINIDIYQCWESVRKLNFIYKMGWTVFFVTHILVSPLPFLLLHAFERGKRDLFVNEYKSIFNKLNYFLKYCKISNFRTIFYFKCF